MQIRYFNGDKHYLEINQTYACLSNVHEPCNSYRQIRFYYLHIHFHIYNNNNNNFHCFQSHNNKKLIKSKKLLLERSLTL